MEAERKAKGDTKPALAAVQEGIDVAVRRKSEGKEDVADIRDVKVAEASDLTKFQGPEKSQPSADIIANEVCGVHA